MGLRSFLSRRESLLETPGEDGAGGKWRSVRAALRCLSAPYCRGDGAAPARWEMPARILHCCWLWVSAGTVQGDAGRRSLCFLQCMKQGLIKGGNPFWAAGMWAGRGLWWVPPAVPGSGRLGQRGNSQVFRSSSLPETCLAPCPCGVGTTLEPAAVTPSTAPRSHGAAPLNSW